MVGILLFAEVAGSRPADATVANKQSIAVLSTIFFLFKAINKINYKLSFNKHFLCSAMTESEFILMD